MHVPKLEKDLGLEVYATRSPGIGGVIKQNVEDFQVEEILVDGTKARINKSNGMKRSVLGSSSSKNHYLLCVLVKRNWDMFIAIRTIAHQLGIGPSSIQIAGIKDARAVTAQHITIENVSFKDIQNLSLKDIQVHPLGYLRTGLAPFYLYANNFHITISNIKHSRTEIGRRIFTTVEELDMLGGIPNFFGHQRFGTTRPVTHLVGKAVVKGDLKKAAMLFLAKPTIFEHPASRQARQELRRTHDFKKASETFPKQLRYERMMLMSLSQKPDDFAGAFRRLPIRLCRIFIQACQSYLFNRFLSSRIKKGYQLNTAEVGDYAVSVQRSGLPMSTMFKTTSPENIREVNDAVKNGKMRLAMPLIGFRQQPSQGVQGEIEKEILREENISPADFKVAALPDMSSKGELRATMTPLADFSSRDISDDTITMEKRALKLDFTLYRGAYATIILRELMKPRAPIEAGF